MLYIYNAPFLLLQDEMRLLIINCLNKYLNIKCRLDYYRSIRLPILKTLVQPYLDVWQATIALNAFW